MSIAKTMKVLALFLYCLNNRLVRS
jgi:hypothetical protein